MVLAINLEDLDGFVGGAGLPVETKSVSQALGSVCVLGEGGGVYREAFSVVIQLAVMLHRLGINTPVEGGGLRNGWAGSRSYPRGDLTFASAFTRSASP